MMVKRLKVLGLLAVAIFILGAVVSSLSAAAEMRLPEFTVQTNGTGTTGEGTFFGAAEIKCKSGKGTGTATSKKTGTATGEFKECSALGDECHSLGDKAGVILGGGSGRLVLDVLAGIDHRLVLSEEKEIHIECKFLNTLLIVKGDGLGTVEAKAGTKREFIVKVLAKGKKEQEYKEYETDLGEKIKVHLESSVNEGAFEESAENGGTGTVITEKETELIN